MVDRISPTTFWSVMGVVVSVIGGIVLLSMSHSAVPRHAEAADEKRVVELEVKVQGVAVEVTHNKEMLVELRDDVKEFRVEQRQMTNEILNEIRTLE